MIMLIGGRSVNPSNYIIEEEMLKGYNLPKVLLFPTATIDSIKSINNLKSLFDRFNCKYEFALLFSEDKSSIIKKINDSDILYFAGGNTNVLVSKIKELGLDEYLLNTKKDIVGISAGAIMMCNAGMGDSYSYIDNNHTYNYKMVKGLGILDIVICPHYDNEDLYVFNDEVIKYNCSSYALENDTAIIFKNNHVEVIKSDLRKSVYFFDKEMDYKMSSIYKNKSIAVLGPAGTFCDVAAKKYIKSNELNLDINYYPSINKTINAIKDNDIAILPFENSLDGYVYETIDKLLNDDYKIISDISVPVDFAFVTNAKNVDECKNVFVQFKAKAECLDFLTNEHDFNLITTDSNMASLNALKDKGDDYGAVIPMHKVNDVSYNTVVNNISDHKNNVTRFVVVSKDKEYDFSCKAIRCSMCIYFLEDYPGILFEVLKVFNDASINLNTILSRPTKEGLGKYNFYIELSSDIDKIDNIYKCIDILSDNKKYIVKIMGLYPLK